MCEPTICTDILTWNYTTLPFVPYVFWAGIPCTTFSNASFKRNTAIGNELALKTLEILRYFQQLNPNLIYGLDNPWSSLLKKQSYMQGIPYKVCDYCRYATEEEGFGYKKRTVIFGNIPWKPKLCLGEGLCENMVGTYHKQTAQQGIQRKPPYPLQKKTHTQVELYRYPPRLCKDLVEAIKIKTPP